MPRDALDVACSSVCPLPRLADRHRRALVLSVEAPIPSGQARCSKHRTPVRSTRTGAHVEDHRSGPQCAASPNHRTAPPALSQRGPTWGPVCVPGWGRAGQRWARGWQCRDGRGLRALDHLGHSTLNRPEHLPPGSVRAEGRSRASSPSLPTSRSWERENPRPGGRRSAAERRARAPGAGRRIPGAHLARPWPSALARRSGRFQRAYRDSPETPAS